VRDSEWQYWQWKHAVFLSLGIVYV
jgi:hypothetical protein